MHACRFDFYYVRFSDSESSRRNEQCKFASLHPLKNAPLVIRSSELGSIDRLPGHCFQYRVTTANGLLAPKK
jgi:hypothetical protein